MKERRTIIGYNRRVDYKWLECTAELVCQGTSSKEIYQALSTLLQNQMSVGNNAKGSNREKTINILLKTWVNVSKEIVPLRDEGIAFLKILPAEDHKAIHWGMSMAAYSFWGIVAETTGRLLRLQGTVSASQVQRRIKEKYGQRETVSRAARFVLRAFIDWNVLKETGRKGIYCQADTINITDQKLIGWLVEVALYARDNGSAALNEILDAPSLFPFRFSPMTADYLVASSPRLDVVRHGMDDDLIMLIK